MINNYSIFSPSISIDGYSNSLIARRESRDCVVRAIANGFDITYDEAHKFAKDFYGRRDKKGTNSWTYHHKNDELSRNGTKIFGKTLTTITYKPVNVEARRNVQRASYWDDSSESYNYDKTLTLYTKRGKKYSQMTTGAFIKKYPKGTFIISVRAHTFTIKDGKVYGNWSDNKMRVRIKKAWEVK